MKILKGECDSHAWKDREEMEQTVHIYSPTRLTNLESLDVQRASLYGFPTSICPLNA